MKAHVIEPFGFAAIGDTMLKAVSHGDGLYWGYLRTRRRYVEFIIPAASCGQMEVETDEDAEYHARHHDPETAHAELARLGSKATQREQVILAALRKRGAAGATSREASELTGIPHVSTSTTMTKMVRKRMLEDTTDRRDAAIVRIAIQNNVDQGMLC